MVHGENKDCSEAHEQPHFRVVFEPERGCAVIGNDESGPVRQEERRQHHSAVKCERARHREGWKDAHDTRRLTEPWLSGVYRPDTACSEHVCLSEWHAAHRGVLMSPSKFAVV